jgi:hypothetical protein
MAAVQRFCNRAVVLEEGKLRFEGDVAAAIRINEKIMYRRLQRQTKSPSGLQPVISGNATLIQDGVRCEGVLDISRDFTVEALVSVDGRELIQDGMTFGVGLFSRGHLLAGFDTADLAVPDPAALLRESGQAIARFEVRGGLKGIWAGTLQVVVSVKDDKSSRSLAAIEVASLQVTNSRLGDNRRGYMMSVAGADIKFDLSPRH